MADFLVDENLPPKLAVWLRRFGYRAQAVREVGLKGKSDEEIIGWVQKRGAVIITSDLDFGEFFYWKNLGNFGVIILRSKSQSAAAFEKLLRMLHSEKVLKGAKLSNSLIVAEEKGYRWRRFE